MNQLVRNIGMSAAVFAIMSAVACESDEDSPSAALGGSGGSATGGATSQAGGMSSAAPQSADIVATALAAGSFTKLAAALDATGLTAALKGAGPFTVFAPTDAAFAAFESANPGVLASLSKEQLAGILKYHVVTSKVMSKDLVSGSLVETLNGSRAAIDLSSGATVAGAKVTQADVVASNGVI